MSITRLAHDSRAKGVAGLGLALGSAAMFGTSGTFAGALMATGWSPGAVVTLRIGVAALLLTVPALIQLRGRLGLLLRGEVLAFGLVAVAGGQLTYFNAVQRLDVGVALLLEYGGILLVVGWAWLRHGQRPRRLTVAGGIAALAGLVLVLDPGGHRLDPVGVLWAGLAATGLAVYFVMAARPGSGIPPLAMAWASMVVGGVALGVFDAAGLLPFHTSAQPVTLLGHRMSWLVPVAGLAVVAAALAYLAGIAASRMLGAKVASFAGLTEVLFAVLFAWLLLGQQPSGLQLAGGAVVLAGIVLVRADSQREAGRLADAVPHVEPRERVGAAGELADPRPDAVVVQ